MMAAIRAARRTRRHGGKVTLVNPSPRFAERLRLHQVAAGQKLDDHRIVDVVAGTGIEFVEGRAVRIDPQACQVRVEGPEGVRLLGYDTLVYAIGGLTDTTSVPGAGDHAYTLNGPHEAVRLASRLAELTSAGGTMAGGTVAGGAVTSDASASGTVTGGTSESGAVAGDTVVVCGGGLTGVETATEIAESHPRLKVVLLSRERPGTMMGDKAREHLERALTRLGVEVRIGADIVKVLPDAVELADGELVACDACVWTVGVRVSPLASEAGIATDERGRIMTDATLRSISHPSVYAIGDAAAVRQSYGVIHGTCQSGIPTGVHAADSIGRERRGRQPRPFRFGYIHQPVSLGRGDAVIQFTRPDDTPRRACLTGRRAVAYKEFVSSSPIKTYGLIKRFAIPGAALWTRGGRSNRLPE